MFIVGSLFPSGFPTKMLYTYTVYILFISSVLFQCLCCESKKKTNLLVRMQVSVTELREFTHRI
jgi:hypothetical protein